MTFTLSGPLVTETKALQTKVKKHKVRSLTFTLKITDAKRRRPRCQLKLAAH